MEFICKNCDKKIEAKDIDEVIKLEKICTKCHKDIKTERVRSTRAKANKIRRDSDSSLHNCLSCGKEFRSVRGKYCSPVCYRTKYNVDRKIEKDRKKDELKDELKAKLKDSNKEFFSTHTFTKGW